MSAAFPSISPRERERGSGRQIRRAWTVLIASTLIFATIVAGVVSGARFYVEHATQPESATLQVVSGSGALVRGARQQDWRLVTGTATVREGDEVSTALGTVVWISMFDGSTAEVSEDSIVRIERMRSSRYLKRTKHFILEPERGSVYVGVAPHGAYDYVEFTIRRPEATITMADGDGSADAGSFLVEVLPAATGSGGSDPLLRVRAAVLRGAATLRTSSATQRLTADQQAIVDSQGAIGPLTNAVRELLQNGDFASGLENWDLFEQQSPRTAGVGPSGASIATSDTFISGAPITAVELRRGAGHDDIVQSGIRQQLGRTLRIYSSLLLQFDVRISDQDPAGGGPDLQSFPLVVKIEYVDVQGQEREWSRGYYAVPDPNSKVPLDRATQIDLGSWQRIAFDLRSLSPLPKQVTSILVYASGRSYRTEVANIRLSSSELDDQRP
jgi:hypothetical protein